MANDNNIKHFTAADIEKYHKGFLSAKEMHDLEKAAMDDPFLSDAMEGYAVHGVNSAADNTELKNWLGERVESAKILPLEKSRPSSFRLLRAAVAIVFVAGAGLLVYQFAFNKKSADIAQADTKQKEAIKVSDSAVATTRDTTTENKPVISKPEQITTGTTVAADDKATGPGGNVSKEVSGEKTVVPGNDVAVSTTKGTQPSVSAPAKVADGQADLYKKTTGKNTEKKEVARNEVKTEAKDKIAANAGQETDKDGVRDQAAQQTEDQKKNRAVAASRKTDEEYYHSQARNTFRGQVTDAANTGVPFANVTNVQDNAGTYTDANGNFILTSPDSILNIQVRSIGFENNNSQLRGDIPTNRVILQDDRRSLSEVVVSNQKPNTAARSRNNNVKLEEPEPADGWDNYDTYLANNLNVPEEYKTKQTNTASVEISFEVDKNGEPVNIKIEKSLCATCDKEAIRLVKDGPKWKRKAKKGRTMVTIPFYNSF